MGGTVAISPQVNKSPVPTGHTITHSLADGITTIKSGGANFFEQLVVDLVLAMVYGSCGRA